jgi:hypothetical protein
VAADPQLSRGVVVGLQPFPKPIGRFEEDYVLRLRHPRNCTFRTELKGMTSDDVEV